MKPDFTVKKHAQHMLSGFVLLGIALFAISCRQQPATIITWEKTYGGSSFEQAYAVEQTTDNGYIVAGQTSSFSAGGYDYYILKLDKLGNKEWEDNFGGTDAELPRDIHQTTDGGYIVAGRSSSFQEGYSDFYIIKLDSDGTKAWEKVYGGDTWEDPHSIQQTSDGGYIVAGLTDSIGAGEDDVYVMKLDSSGNQEWEETYGGTDDDAAMSIVQTSDGGYIVAGYTHSTGSDGRNGYVLKLDGSGAVTWEQAYGGNNHDSLESIYPTSDGGYICTGYTGYTGEDGKDMYVLKLDSTGTVTWEQTYGGLNNDHGYAVQQTKDGNYILCGTMGTASATDMYLAKLDTTGTVTWEKYYGGTDNDEAYDVQQTKDGGFVLAGYTHPADAAAEYDDDMYILKLDKEGSL